MRGRAHIIGIICALLLCQAAWAQRTVSSIPVPDGFERVHPQGFGQYLQSFPLKPEGTPVRYFDGSIKPWQDGAFAVLDIDVGDKDLQQCADAVIRLRAEYLWKERLYQRIHFNFTNAFCADYDKWAQGYRIKIQGNKASWYNAAEEDYQYKTFRKYLDMVFSYAGTASLSKELISVQMADLTIGDIFIVGGHPGHAMIVVDMATDSAGRKAILVAQSYMPAQSIHIVTNIVDRAHSPWYILDDDTTLFVFPEWCFDSTQIKRFQ